MPKTTHMSTLMGGRRNMVMLLAKALLCICLLLTSTEAGLVPTDSPTGVPTDAPTTGNPTASPTAVPTDTPTTTAPSSLPTSAPTEHPDLQILNTVFSALDVDLDTQFEIGVFFFPKYLIVGFKAEELSIGHLELIVEEGESIQLKLSNVFLKASNGKLAMMNSIPNCSLCEGQFDETTYTWPEHLLEDSYQDGDGKVNCRLCFHPFQTTVNIDITIRTDFSGLPKVTDITVNVVSTKHLGRENDLDRIFNGDEEEFERRKNDRYHWETYRDLDGEDDLQWYMNHASKAASTLQAPLDELFRKAEDLYSMQTNLDRRVRWGEISANMVDLNDDVLHFVMGIFNTIVNAPTDEEGGTIVSQVANSFIKDDMDFSFPLMGVDLAISVKSLDLTLLMENVAATTLGKQTALLDTLLGASLSPSISLSLSKSGKLLLEDSFTLDLSAPNMALKVAALLALNYDTLFENSLNSMVDTPLGCVLASMVDTELIGEITLPILEIVLGDLQNEILDMLLRGIVGYVGDKKLLPLVLQGFLADTLSGFMPTGDPVCGQDDTSTPPSSKADIQSRSMNSWMSMSLNEMAGAEGEMRTILDSIISIFAGRMDEPLQTFINEWKNFPTLFAANPLGDLNEKLESIDPDVALINWTSGFVGALVDLLGDVLGLRDPTEKLSLNNLVQDLGLDTLQVDILEMVAGAGDGDGDETKGVQLLELFGIGLGMESLVLQLEGLNTFTNVTLNAPKSGILQADVNLDSLDVSVLPEWILFITMAGNTFKLSLPVPTLAVKDIEIVLPVLLAIDSDKLLYLSVSKILTAPLSCLSYTLEHVPDTNPFVQLIYSLFSSTLDVTQYPLLGSPILQALFPHFSGILNTFSPVLEEFLLDTFLPSKETCENAPDMVSFGFGNKALDQTLVNYANSPLSSVLESVLNKDFAPEEEDFLGAERTLRAKYSKDDLFPVAHNGIVNAIFDYLNNAQGLDCTLVSKFKEIVLGAFAEMAGGLGLGGEGGEGFKLEVGNSTMNLSVRDLNVTGLDDIFSNLTYLTMGDFSLGALVEFPYLGVVASIDLVVEDALSAEIKDEQTIDIDASIEDILIQAGVMVPFMEETVVDTLFGSVFADPTPCLFSWLAQAPAVTALVMADKVVGLPALLKEIGDKALSMFLPFILQVLPEWAQLLLEKEEDWVQEVITVLGGFLDREGVNFDLVRFLSTLAGVLVSYLGNEFMLDHHTGAQCMPPTLYADDNNLFRFDDDTFSFVLEALDSCFVPVLNSDVIPALVGDEGLVFANRSEGEAWEFDLGLDDSFYFNVSLHDISVQNLNTVHEEKLSLFELLASDTEAFTTETGLIISDASTPLGVSAGFAFSVTGEEWQEVTLDVQADELMAYLTAMLQFDRTRVNNRKVSSLLDLNCWLGDLDAGSMTEVKAGQEGLKFGLTCVNCDGYPILEEIATSSRLDATQNELRGIVDRALRNFTDKVVLAEHLGNMEYLIGQSRLRCANKPVVLMQSLDADHQLAKGGLELLVLVSSAVAVAMIASGCLWSYRKRKAGDVEDSLISDLGLPDTEGEVGKSGSEVNVHRLRSTLVDFLLEHDETQEKADEEHVEELVQWTLSHGGKSGVTLLAERLTKKYGKGLGSDLSYLFQTVVSADGTTEQDTEAPPRESGLGGIFQAMSWDYKNAAPLCLHPQVPRWFRLMTPFALVLNIGLFLTGDLSNGARVDVLLNVIGVEKNLDNFYTFSMVDSVEDLWNSGGVVLAILIATLSGAWPYIKTLLMGYCWFRRPSSLSSKRRGSILRILDLLGKFALVEVYFLVLVLASFRLKFLSPRIQLLPDNTYSGDIIVVPIWGLYAFLLASILTLLMSNFMVYYDVNIKDTVEKEEQEQRKLQGKLNDVEGGATGVQENDQEEERMFTLHELNPFPVVKNLLLPLLFIFFVLNLVGLFMPVATLEVVGALRLLMDIGQPSASEDEPLTNPLISFSTISLVQRVGYVMDTSSFTSIIGVCFIIAIYIMTTIILPLLRILYVGIMWFRPITIKGLRRLNFTVEFMSAWCGLEVFMASLLVGVLEIERLSSFFMYEQCPAILPLIDLFANHFPIVPYEGESLTCFTLIPTVKAGAFVLVIVAVGVYVLMQIFMHLIHEALHKVGHDEHLQMLDVDGTPSSPSPNSSMSVYQQQPQEKDDSVDVESPKSGFPFPRRSGSNRSNKSTGKVLEATNPHFEV